MKDNYLRFSKFIITLIWVLLVCFQTRVLGDKTNAIAVRNQIYYLEDFGGIPDSQFFGHDASTYEAFQHTLFSDHLNNSKKWHPSEGNNVNKSELKDLCLTNRKAFNLALQTVKPGDTIQIRDGEGYTLSGGVYGEYLQNITIDFAGHLYFCHDMNIWPYSQFQDSFSPPNRYVPAIQITKSRYITLTSSTTTRPEVIYNMDAQRIELINNKNQLGGMIDGNGKPWWKACYLRKLPDPGCSDRPRLLHISKSADVLVEHLTLINSPYWTFTIEAIDAEIRYVNVLVDRNFQQFLHHEYVQESSAMERKLNDKVKNLRPNFKKARSPLPDNALQPLNLNTDGIDAIGLNIWIHDCMVLNDDDSICIKPATKNNTINWIKHDDSQTMKYDCTQYIIVENAVLTGFGATIGSVGPSPFHNCVDNVIFRNVTMPKTGKGKTG